MRDRVKLILLTILVTAVAACDNNGKDAGDATPNSSNSATTKVAPQVSASGAALAPASASAALAGNAAPGAGWAGSYKSEPGTLYVPTEVANGKDWKAVKWRGDLSNAGLGDGPMTLAVDATGRVSGSLEGPLGPALINGQLAEGKLTATITRKNPSDGGFVGTLVGSVEGDKVTGTLKLSQRAASVIRSATFSAAKK